MDINQNGKGFRGKRTQRNLGKKIKKRFGQNENKLVEDNFFFLQMNSKEQREKWMQIMVELQSGNA